MQRRLRTQCRLKEKLSENPQAAKPTTDSASEDTLANRVKARRRQSEATLVPEFTFTVSPDPTVVLNSGAEQVRDNHAEDDNRMQLRCHGARKRSGSGRSTPTSRNDRQPPPSPKEHAAASAAKEPPRRQSSSKRSGRRRGASRRILEDVTNNSVTAPKRSTRQSSKALASITNDGTSRDATESSHNEAVQGDDVADGDGINVFQGGDDEFESNSGIPEDAVENEKATKDDDDDDVTEHTPPLEAEVVALNADLAIEREGHGGLAGDRTVPSTSLDEAANHDSNDVLETDEAADAKSNDGREQIDPTCANKELHEKIALADFMDDNNVLASTAVGQATEEANEDLDSSHELSFESRAIRKKISERLEEISSDEDSFCGEPTNAHHVSQASTLFDVLLQEEPVSSDPGKAPPPPPPNENSTLPIVDKGATGKERHEAEPKVTEDADKELACQFRTPLVLLQRVVHAGYEAASAVGDAELDDPATIDDNLTLRFEQLRKSSAEFKQALPSHMAAHRRVTANMSTASFTSDEAAGASELQIFAGAAVSQALTILEDPSHETPASLSHSPRMAGTLQRECVSRDVSIDSDADIDVLMQSKCVGTTGRDSTFLERSGHAKVASPRRHHVATSMTDPRASAQQRPDEQDNDSFELVLDDPSNQASVSRQDMSINNNAKINLVVSERAIDHQGYSDCHRGSNGTYVKTNGEEQLVQQTESNPAANMRLGNAHTAANAALKIGGTPTDEERPPCEIKQERDLKGNAALSIPASLYPEEEDPAFVDEELDELRPPRKSKLESTRLPNVDAVSVFVISDDEHEMCQQAEEQEKLTADDEDANFVQKENNICRNDIAVATGPSLFETRVGTSTSRFDEAAPPQPTPLAIVDEPRLIGDNNAEKQNISTNNGSAQDQARPDAEDDAYTGEAIARTQSVSEIAIAPAEGEIVIVASDLVADTTTPSNASTASKASPKDAANCGNDVASAIRVVDEVVMTIVGDISRETSIGKSKLVKNDAFHDRGEKELLDLLGDARIRMPGFNTTAPTVASTTSPQAPGGRQRDSGSAANATPGPARLLNHELDASQSPTNVDCIQRYRIAETKPYDGGRETVFSPKLATREGEPMRRRCLFREDSDEIIDLLPEQGSPRLSTAGCRRAKGFMLDSNRLPHFNESYIDVDCDGAALKVRGEELFANAIKAVMECKPGISKHVRRALEGRVLRDHEESLKEIMVLLVRKAAMRDEFERLHEMHGRQQNRLEHARNFINAKVDKLLPEGENDVVKVLGFNPYGGQMPPPESVRLSTIRKYRETNKQSSNKRRRESSSQPETDLPKR